jgi:hypothetical protein
MEAVCSSKTFENVYQTTRLHIPEDSYFHSDCRDNLKSPIFDKLLDHTQDASKCRLLLASEFFSFPHICIKVPTSLHTKCMGFLLEKLKVNVNFI